MSNLVQWYSMWKPSLAMLRPMQCNAMVVFQFSPTTCVCLSPEIRAPVSLHLTLSNWEPVEEAASHHELLPSPLDHRQSGNFKWSRWGIKTKVLSSGDPANTNRQVFCSFFVIYKFCRVNYPCRLSSELQQKTLNRCLLLDPFCEGPLPIWNLVLSRKTMMNLWLSLWSSNRQTKLAF